MKPEYSFSYKEQNSINNVYPVVLLFGGCGNRLFQIARALDLKKSGLHPAVVEIEQFFEVNWMVSKLLRWTQHPMWIDINALCDSLGIHRTKPSFVWRARLYGSILRLIFSNRRRQLNTTFAASRRSMQIGYFQEIDSISRDSVFAIADAVHDQLDTAVSDVPQVVMHVRGGDFAIKDRLSADVIAGFVAANPDCVCVTNDRNYVAHNYPLVRVPHSNGPRADFTTLSQACLILPSNSTFCFWASAIAKQRHNAQLWFLPSDDYWRQINDGRST